MKVLIVGYGSIGRRHFRNLRSLGVQDILFCRTGRSTLDDSELNGFPVYTDLSQALAQKPHSVIIANPTAYHMDAAIPAAEQGCHILLEKPVSHNMDRVDEFIQVTRKSGSRVLVGYQFRYHPNLIQIKELLEKDVIGKPLAVRTHWGEYLPSLHPWEDYRKSYSARKDLGGGVLLTLCHNFDYLRWLFGNATVKASLLGSEGGLGIDVEDTAEVLLLFDSLLIASVHLNYLQQPSKNTMEIIGRQGSIFWDYYKNRVDLALRHKDGQVENQSFFCPEDFDRNSLFLTELRHFLEVAEGKISPLCTLDDGIQTLDLILKAGG